MLIDPLDQLHRAVGKQDLGDWPFSGQNDGQGTQHRLYQYHLSFEIGILHPAFFVLIPVLPDGRTLDQRGICNDTCFIIFCT